MGISSARHAGRAAVRRAAAGAVAVVAVTAAGAAVLALTASGVQAESCRVVELRYLTGQGLTGLDPSTLTVPAGTCVSFRNSTATTATFRVGSGYSAQVQPADQTAPSTSFRAQASGRYDVTAQAGPSTASGSLTVTAAPSPSPSPSPTAARAAGGPSPAASPRPASPSRPRATAAPPHRAGTGGTGSRAGAGRGRIPAPVRAGVPGPVGTAAHRPLARSAQPASPPPTAAAAAPALDASVGVLHRAAGPVEPASGRALGLPAAVAGLLAVGVATALGRVLLGLPVDDRETVVPGA